MNFDFLPSLDTIFSEILAIDQFIAAFEHSEPSETDFILLAYIAHVKELLVMEDKKLSLPVQVRGKSYRREWPPDELFQHVHAAHAGK